MNREDGFCLLSHGNLSSAPLKIAGNIPYRIL
jgi:hypothetical protein